MHVEQAVAALEPGGRLVGVSRLTGGVSADVLGLVIATAAGGERRVVYRRHRSPDVEQHGSHVTAKEHALLGALHRAGFPVPEPYLCVDGDGALGPALVMEWIDGSTDVAAADLPGALEQMAQLLVRLHALDPRDVAVAELEPIEDPVTSIVDVLPPTTAGERVREAIASGALSHHAERSVVLHGDFWPGNVLWDGGRLVAVIDWEDACLGDPMADVATARVELLCRYGWSATERFTSRYLAMAPDAVGGSRPDPLTVWDLYVSAAALSAMASWGLEPAEEAHRRRLTQGFFDRAAARVGA